MKLVVPAAAQAAATLPLFPEQSRPDTQSALFQAGTSLAQALGQGRALDAHTLRAAMETAFGGSDAEGAWDWKLAYDACEAAQVLFLRQFGPAMRARAGSPAAFLAMLGKLAALLPSQTRRSEESQALQQFSTPIALGFAAATAAAITPADLVLEPSAGTGLLAIFAELAGARLALNELADTRAESARCAVSEYAGHAPRRGAYPRSSRPRRPPDRRADESALLGRGPCRGPRRRRRACATSRRLSHVLPTAGASSRSPAPASSPDNPAWRDGFVRLQERGRVVFSAAIDGRVYARHGTTVDTRLTVIDRVPAADPTIFPSSPGIATDPAVLLDWIARLVPPRASVAPTSTRAPASSAALRALPARPAVQRFRPAAAPVPIEAVELAYEPCDWAQAEGGHITDALYEGYSLQSIRIPGAQPHPTRLVQSAAMASVAPPKPSYRPHLPAAVVGDGLLSPTPSSRASSMPARPMRAISPAPGRWTRPSMSSRLRPTTPRTPCASAAAGFWATAPAPARAARSPASSSTIGLRAAAARSGSRSPTS